MTAIQASQHKQFCKAIDLLTLSYELAALTSDKILMEKIYAEYQQKINEVQQLIREYKKIQIQTRKKMSDYKREMQRPARADFSLTSRESPAIV